MPSKSKAQHRLMEAAAHDPSFAKKAGVPQSVAREFVSADRRSGEHHAWTPGTHKAKGMQQ